jgi:hypothetical protein
METMNEYACVGTSPDFMIVDEEADMSAFAKKSRSRSGAPNKSSSRHIRSFMTKMAGECPHTVGAELDVLNETLPATTLLARVIHAIEYTPSKVELLADHTGLARKGFIVDTDLNKMTLRQMTDHCAAPMLEELATKMREHEAGLVALLVEPEEPAAPVQEAPARKTILVNDEMLGRVEIDAETAEVVRIVPDNDAMGEVLVDDAEHVDVESGAETAKGSTVWGSW